jgi:hypothetical protein
MKQAVLTFEKKRVLLVELPEGAYGVCQTHIYHGVDPITFHIEGEGDKCYHFKVDGFVDVIGKLSELTEEQARDIVENWERHFPEQHTVYRNYEKPVEYDAIKRSSEQKWDEPFGKAVESFLSKIKAEGLFLINPFKKTKVTVKGSLKDKEQFSSMWKARREQAEARTFSPSRTWVFTIKPTPTEGEQEKNTEA